MIKYVEKMVVFQEIPDEISLSYSISNCPYHCDGCHSAYLADDIGKPLYDELMIDLHQNYDKVSCILFMGGDDERQREELVDCLRLCKFNGYKTALYTGASVANEAVLPFLDYIKIGPYIKELGPLNNKTTNQRLFSVINGQIDQDITYKFWK